MTDRPTGVCIHESASRWGSLELVDDWHKDRAFRRSAPVIQSTMRHVGYHYVIENGHPLSAHTHFAERDGIVRTGRWETEQGAHAIGDNSRIGICLIGRAGVFSPAQYAGLYGLLLSICWRYQLPPATVIGHYESRYEQAQPATTRKSCPGLDMGRVRARLGILLGLFNGELDRSCRRR